jgi:uncharacterized membrane protein YhiD involved in acid resistance
MHLAAAAAPVTGAAVITTISRIVLNIVRTVIATRINLEVEVSRKRTEAVADAEEDQEAQDKMEEDSIESIHKQEEEEQEELHLEEGLATTTTATGMVASMALAKKMDSTNNTTTN